MASPSSERRRLPLDSKRLEELALRYVGRFATTRAKLGAYLLRKVRERGWGGDGEPDVDGITARFCELGYVDDAAFALAKSHSLSRRGYGRRRLEDVLKGAGIADEEGAAAREHAQGEALEAALRFARRRRIGPFASAAGDAKERQRAIAAMVRAGHDFALACAIARLAPGAEVDRDALSEEVRLVL